MAGIDAQLGSAIHQAIEETVGRSPVEPYLFELTPEVCAAFGWEADQAQRILTFAADVVRHTFSASRAWENIQVACGNAVSLAIEREFTVTLPSGHRYMARPDMVFMEEEVSTIVNIKSSASTAEWSKWGIQPSIVGEFWALETLGHTLRGSWVFHVNKGRKMPGTQGVRYFASPLFIGYERNGEVSPEYKAGWQRVWLWEKFTPLAWAEMLKTQFRANLETIYEVSGPHLPDPQQLALWQAAVEHELTLPTEDNPRLYPRHFGRACLWPQKCSMYDFCWGMAELDPAANGFVPRIPNHPQETDSE